MWCHVCLEVNYTVQWKLTRNDGDRVMKQKKTWKSGSPQIEFVSAINRVWFPNDFCQLFCWLFFSCEKSTNCSNDISFFWFVSLFLLISSCDWSAYLLKSRTALVSTKKNTHALFTRPGREYTYMRNVSCNKINDKNNQIDKECCGRHQWKLGSVKKRTLVLSFVFHKWVRLSPFHFQIQHTNKNAIIIFVSSLAQWRVSEVVRYFYFHSMIYMERKRFLLHFHSLRLSIAI